MTVAALLSLRAFGLHTDRTPPTSSTSHGKRKENPEVGAQMEGGTSVKAVLEMTGTGRGSIHGCRPRRTGRSTPGEKLPWYFVQGSLHFVEIRFLVVE